MFDGKIELIDKLFWRTPERKKRPRSGPSKVAVFGILKRKGKVYTVVVNDTKTQTLMPLTPEKIKPDSIVYTDSYK